ncbi:hypothetical protein [Paraburkholderia caribensis]|uniref:hypothetical protein n=1 Tax=Paraburkholderia caribensis TaxID=75105 RepID=UPI001CB26A5E|nr:hypothetical protein [Paraburkholderia caribensis]CAG9262177.1 hypothetical protein PCAR4_560019 [Paraburkholderia caribensis]
MERHQINVTPDSREDFPSTAAQAKPTRKSNASARKNAKTCQVPPKEMRGGARHGAGRKPSPSKSNTGGLTLPVAGVPIAPDPLAHASKDDENSGAATYDRDMLALLRDIALGRVEATALQVRAAIAAVQYTHAKMGEGGKKAAKAAAAQKAAGKFASLPPPRLVVNNGT